MSAKSKDSWKKLPLATKIAIRDGLRKRRFQEQYCRDRVAFWHDCFHWPAGEGPKAHQEEGLALFDIHPRVCICSPRHGGKSAIGSIEVLHGYLCYDEIKIPTTASRWLQLEKFLWPEIHKWASRINWDAVNYRAPFRRDELLVREIKSKNAQQYAFAAACDDPLTIEGAHSRVIRYLYDEGKSIPGPTWDSPEGAFAGSVELCELAEWRAMSTPGVPAGRFWDIMSRKPGFEDWHTLRWTLEQLLEGGMVDEVWIKNRADQWGVNSPMYQNHVLGNFASFDENALVPLAWVEAAHERWHEWDRKGRPIPKGGARRLIGCDPASSGNDPTAIVERITGLGVVSVDYYQDMTEMTIAGELVRRKSAVNGDLPVDVFVEVGGGYGGGVVSRMQEQGHHVMSVVPSSRSDACDVSGEIGFLNLRTQLAWAVRDWLDPDQGADPILPPDDRMTADLTSVRIMPTTSTGKMRIEGKDQLSKSDRLGRSPDGWDALKTTFSVRTDPDVLGRILRSREAHKDTMRTITAEIGAVLE